MPFVKAICSNCGGILEVDNSREAAICPFCGTPYIVEKAVQQYYTVVNNTNNIEHATFVNGFNEERYLENGIMQLKLKRYDDAADTFKSMSKDYPGNWKAWYGIALTDFYRHPGGELKLSEEERRLIPADIRARVENESISTLAYKLTRLKEIDEEIAGLEESVDRGKKRSDAQREFLDGADKRFKKNNGELMLMAGAVVLLLLIVAVSILAEAYIVTIIAALGLSIGLILLFRNGLALMWVHDRRQASKDAKHFSSMLRTEEYETAQLGAKITKKIEKRERLTVEVKSALENMGVLSVADYYFSILDES